GRFDGMAQNDPRGHSSESQTQTDSRAEGRGEADAGRKEIRVCRGRTSHQLIAWRERSLFVEQTAVAVAEARRNPRARRVRRKVVPVVELRHELLVEEVEHVGGDVQRRALAGENR